MLRTISAISFSLLFLVGCAFAEQNVDDVCAEHKCQIIIDAGSSGSRLHLYVYDEDANKDPVNIYELLNNRVQPGFADLQIEQVGPYLENLMSTVPINNIDVHFYATAGMRLLPEDKQQELYNQAHAWFTEQAKWKLSEARTISGSEEGVFGWLAVYNTIPNNSFELPGFIEVGGASTQVVFPISNYTGINYDNIVTVNINGRRINLFAHSFLGMGANEITRKFSNVSACFPIGYPLMNGDTATGDGKSCQQEIMAVLNAGDYISRLVKHPYQHNPVTSWYTVGALGTIAEKAPLGLHADTFIMDDLFAKSNSIYCQQDWQLQQENYASSDKYLAQNCIMSSFFYGLVTEGYGINSQQEFKIFSGKATPEWTLGAMLAKVETEHHS